MDSFATKPLTPAALRAIVDRNPAGVPPAAAAVLEGSGPAGNQPSGAPAAGSAGLRR